MSEKRTFSRIETSVRAHMRRVASTSDRQIFHDCPSCEADGAQSKLKGANLHEDLVEFLSAMDRKLDLLLSLVSRRSLKGDFPIDALVTDLSGSGLRFLASEPFKAGDAAEIVLVLTHSPLRMASAIGQVVRCERRGDKVACIMDFARIRDNDLESVVQFVFQEERAQIRQQKWT